MFKKRNNHGKVLMENVVFIILNVMFLMILVLFISKSGQGASLLEETYSKQISLLIDSAKPGMTIVLDMEKAREIAEKNGLEFEEIISSRDNLITVKLDENSGHSYSYFNKININLYPDSEINSYVIKILEYD